MADDEDASESEPAMEFTDDDEDDMEAMQNVPLGPHFITNFQKQNHFSS